MKKFGKDKPPAKSALSDKPSQRPESTNNQTVCPYFSFEKMDSNSNHSVTQCDVTNKVALANKLFELSQLTWLDIIFSPKQGMGSEKIPRSAIKVPIPPNITEDVEEFLSIRYNGKRPMVGYREGRIFHIVFLDHNFKVYNHGP